MSTVENISHTPVENTLDTPVPVKICGITRVADALCAEACGARAIGFIFYPPSPRYCPPEQVAEIVARLHSHTLKVGVFVGETVENMNALALQCGLDRIQMHGGEPFERLAELQHPGYRVLRLKREEDLDAAELAPDTTVMLDTFDPDLHGGTGRPFNWEWARRLGASRRVILSGGLTPDNITRALETARPAAVDASSGLESAPGIKDPIRIEQFFAALRTAPGPIHSNWSDTHVFAN